MQTRPFRFSFKCVNLSASSLPPHWSGHLRRISARQAWYQLQARLNPLEVSPGGVEGGGGFLSQRGILGDCCYNLDWRSPSCLWIFFFTLSEWTRADGETQIPPESLKPHFCGQQRFASPADGCMHSSVWYTWRPPAVSPPAQRRVTPTSRWPANYQNLPLFLAVSWK